MIYKVLYQKDKVVNPRRETTETLYMEADNLVSARTLVEENTPYNIELIQELAGNSLDYEKEHADFKLTSFENKK
ncbi:MULTISPECIES: DNA-dependent RNA polymerase subunit epsilon [unclassified Lactobacillus]|uniref:DNA-dependent RNA polymerase subunit epsilon n=1 Tax=unclassified Lactobacillus TaxID=2620435 RepID=UPI0023F72603|nr:MULTISPECIES: DNA-dependent RNA polymerase subunit epsilon [unclassified Lactobacillus]MDF7668415.1 DNA-dependent RNA polymerase subunit epsilon [Lactobacillus sp. ESL0703]WEV39363.1 DNA-dependent RNA polymerase subunit epsilon [Lactobacillus sp. ESL0680]